MKIIAAAMRIGALVVSMPQPARHHTILHELDAQGINPLIHPVDQGFITSDGAFIERGPAVAVARAAGQLPSGDPQWPPYLYSEDLW